MALFHVKLTCWYAWKQTPASSVFLMISVLLAMPRDCIAEGVNLTPSNRRVTGAKMKNDMMVMMLNRLMLSNRTDPCMGEHHTVSMCLHTTVPMM